MKEGKTGYRWVIICAVLAVALLGAMMTGCSDQKAGSDSGSGNAEPQTETSSVENEKSTAEDADVEDLVVSWDESWQYADYSKIHSSDVTLYRAQKSRKDVTVALNAGHGTSGGSSVKTLCHPDKTPKVVSGSTAAGETTAAAVSEGTTMLDSSPERDVTLALALTAKEVLLDTGYDVLMIRETEDVQLDNIARTVIANNYADCHIALHYDYTENDKGLFYIDVPDVASYRNMEPVASHWQEHHALGEAILSGMRDKNVKIYGDGTLAIDLTQTSYSTIPSIDLEVGDRASDVSQSTLENLSEGMVEGLDQFFSK